MFFFRCGSKPNNYIKNIYFPLENLTERTLLFLFWNVRRMWGKLHVTWPQSIPGQDHRKGTSQWTTGADYFPKTRRSIKKTHKRHFGDSCAADAPLLFSPSWDFPPNLRVKGLILRRSLPVEAFPVRGRGEGESLLARSSRLLDLNQLSFNPKRLGRVLRSFLRHNLGLEVPPRPVETTGEPDPKPTLQATKKTLLTTAQVIQ